MEFMDYKVSPSVSATVSNEKDSQLEAKVRNENEMVSQMEAVTADARDHLFGQVSEEYSSHQLIQFTDFLDYKVDTVRDDRGSHMDGDPVDDQSTSRDHLFGQVYNRKKTDVVETDVVANVEGTNPNPVSAPDDPSPIDEELSIALRKGSRPVGLLAGRNDSIGGAGSVYGYGYRCGYGYGEAGTEIADVKGDLPISVGVYHMSYLTRIKSCEIVNLGRNQTEKHGNNGESEITFLYRLIPGLSGRSFGLNVASLAQLPSTCIAKASVMAKKLESVVQSKAGGTLSGGVSDVKFICHENGVTGSDRTGHSETCSLSSSSAVCFIDEFKDRSSEIGRLGNIEIFTVVLTVLNLVGIVVGGTKCKSDSGKIAGAVSPNSTIVSSAKWSPIAAKFGYVVALIMAIPTIPSMCSDFLRIARKLPLNRWVCHSM
ncbi:DNA mismatch repair protein [Nymphaea thermarum]|nr:DNA mismatch repair protein [Nymphaea thermarum]